MNNLVLYDKSPFDLIESLFNNDDWLMPSFRTPAIDVYEEGDKYTIEADKISNWKSGMASLFFPPQNERRAKINPRKVGGSAGSAESTNSSAVLLFLKR